MELSLLIRSGWKSIRFDIVPVVRRQQEPLRLKGRQSDRGFPQGSLRKATEEAHFVPASPLCWRCAAQLCCPGDPPCQHHCRMQAKRAMGKWRDMSTQGWNHPFIMPKPAALCWGKNLSQISGSSRKEAGDATGDPQIVAGAEPWLPGGCQLSDPCSGCGSEPGHLAAAG